MLESRLEPVPRKYSSQRNNGIMASFTEFLQNLLNDGEVVFRAKPVPSVKDHAGAEQILRRAHAGYRLDLAGPLLEFRAETAMRAAELVRQACWFLVSHDEPDEVVMRMLTMPPAEVPADHLTADLVFRYLAQVERRARGHAPDDALAKQTAKLLREWPLSGIMSDAPDAPLTPLDFGGHSGLLMLYAERLARNEKPEWLPQSQGREYVELVYRDLSREHAPFLKQAALTENWENKTQAPQD